MLRGAAVSNKQTISSNNRACECWLPAKSIQDHFNQHFISRNFSRTHKRGAVWAGDSCKRSSNQEKNNTTVYIEAHVH